MNGQALFNVVPLSIILREVSRTLEILWRDSARSVVSYRELRMSCKCAVCEQARRSGSAQHSLADVTVKVITECGPAAVQFVFSDGHSRGIYPFTYLRQLGVATV